MSFFSKTQDNSNQVKALQDSISRYRDENADLHKHIRELAVEHGKEIEEIKYEHSKKIREIDDTHARAIENANHEYKMLEAQKNDLIRLEVDEAVRKVKEQIIEKVRLHDVAEAKLKMYEGAFAELGLDVKDTKEIISDLIKALGIKSQVQVIK